MGYPIESKLVIAVASSALFDLRESDKVFREQGEEEYRRYQRDRESQKFSQGVAFPFIRRFLDLNRIDPKNTPVEVVLLSRNDPDTGLRVFNSIEAYKLDISRAAFVNGPDPYRYMEPFNAALFLSGNAEDVRAAIQLGLPAGLVFGTQCIDNDDDELRIAFDFDGVLADDSAEKVFEKSGTLSLFHQSEKEKALEALGPGPLKDFFSKIATLQDLEYEKQRTQANYKRKIRTAIVTARNAPAHTRVITTLRNWGIRADEAFFLGGVEKSRILSTWKPHIFFDDQLSHIRGTAEEVPSVHIPFGIRNQLAVSSEPPSAAQEATMAPEGEGVRSASIPVIKLVADQSTGMQ